MKRKSYIDRISSYGFKSVYIDSVETYGYCILQKGTSSDKPKWSYIANSNTPLFDFATEFGIPAYIENEYTGIVRAKGRLRMRNGTGENYSVIRKIPDHASVNVYGKYQNWLFVEYEYQYGWVGADYVN